LKREIRGLSLENGKANSEDRDLIFDCHPNIPPLITPGEYEVGFLRAEKKWLWHCEKLFLHFQIVSFGDWHGARLFMACTIAPKGKWRPSHKFYQAWVIAKQKSPDRFDRMSTIVFKGKLFRAKVKTVENTSKGNKRIPQLQYSIIDDLIKRTQ
jgi:hypothetical protein